MGLFHGRAAGARRGPTGLSEEMTMLSFSRWAGRPHRAVPLLPPQTVARRPMPFGNLPPLPARFA